MLAISIPAVLYSDRMGRRTSVIVGGGTLSFCMLVIGVLYASNSVHSTGPARWVVVVLIFAFALTYCSTWGMVGKMYASEIQPARTRAAASCVAQGLNFVSFTNYSTSLAITFLTTKAVCKLARSLRNPSFPCQICLWSLLPFRISYAWDCHRPRSLHA